MALADAGATGGIVWVVDVKAGAVASGTAVAAAAGALTGGAVVAVSVGGTGVFVAVGGTGVAVLVFVGGTGVSVAIRGTGVSVAVGVSVGAAVVVPVATVVGGTGAVVGGVELATRIVTACQAYWFTKFQLNSAQPERPQPAPHWFWTHRPLESYFVAKTAWLP